jgi:type I restriction enzyme S subunit
MEEWKNCYIGDVCSTISETYKANSSEVVLVNTSDVLEGKCLNHIKVDNKDLKGQFKKAFHQNDILYSEIRPANKRFAFIDFEPTDYIASTKLMVIRNNESILPEYLFYILQSKTVIEELQMLAESRSGTFPQITFSEVSRMQIKLPNTEEQIKILGVLKSLDKKIELNRRINDNLEQQAQALYKSWFIDFEPFKDGKFVDSEIGIIPEVLELCNIGSINHRLESGRRPKGGASLEGVPSIGAESIKGLGKFDYTKTKYIPKDFAKSMKKGSIQGYELLIYKDGGKPGYFIPNFSIFGEEFPYKEMYINEHVFLLDFEDAGYNIFAYFYMQTAYIMNQLNSIGGKAAIPGINSSDVESLPIFRKNNNYIRLFGEIVMPLIRKILSNCKENAKLANVRDKILPQLMSGELKINEINK